MSGPTQDNRTLTSSTSPQSSKFDTTLRAPAISPGASESLGDFFSSLPPEILSMVAQLFISGSINTSGMMDLVKGIANTNDPKDLTA